MSAVIKNPGKFQMSSSITLVTGLMAVVGLGAFLVQLSTDPHRAWSSFVLNHFYFLTLGLGGIVFAAIQWLTNAMWSAPIRRILEAFSGYLPFVVLTMLVLFYGLHHVYTWTDVAMVSKDPILSGKSGYLSPGFFLARNLGAILIWIYFARKMIGNSVAQDANGDFQYTERNRFLSPIFIIVFALTFTMASFDQMMSLDPYWFSTIFGIYMFAGMLYSTLAALCLGTLYLKGKGYLDGLVNDNHIHDIGKFMFAFTVFWAYIAFSQFMLIWYANLPEETGYYLRRFNSGWLGLSIFLLVGKFLVPFVFLLPRGAKRSEARLKKVAIFMLIAQWIDVLWIVQPEFFQEGPRVGIFEILIAMGFLGVFIFLTLKFLSKHNVVAIGDPRLEEAVSHHHQ